VALASTRRQCEYMTKLLTRILYSKWPSLFACALFSLVLSACGGNATKVAEELKQAGTYYFDGDFDKGIVLCDSVLRSDSKNTSAYLFRGMARARKGNLDKAVEDFDHLVQIDNRNTDALLGRGYVWLLKGENDKALNDYTAAIRIDPGMPAAHISRGNAFRAKGQFNNAITDFTKAIQLYTESKSTSPDANLAEAYCGRGYALVEKGNYSKANEDFLQALQVDPTGLGPCGAMGWFRATCPQEQYRDGTEAVAFSTKACELSHWKDGPYLDTLAAAYAEAGDWENAVLRQEQAVELAFDDKNKEERQARLELYRRKETFRDTPQETP
jgi:tetratricopeptide (TPR) repeat protein